MPLSKKIAVYTALIFSMFFWGYAFVWGKIALSIYNPITVIFFRVIIASAIIIPFGLLTKKLQSIKKEDYKHILLLAFFEPFLYFLGENYGLQLVSPTIASVLIALIPLFVPIAAYFILKDKLSIMNILGIVISIIGVVVLIFKKNFDFEASPKGVALMCIAVFAAVGYSMGLKNLVKKYNGLTLITYQNIIGVFAFLPLFFILDFSKFTAIGIKPEALIAILKLAIFATIIAFIFFAYGVKYIGINKSAVFTNIIPVFTIIIAYFIFKDDPTLAEKITIKKIAGIAIVIAGLFISQIKKRNKESDLK